MTINEFAAMNHDRAMNAHSGKMDAFDIEYFLIALGGEVGECLNLLKKYKRGDFEDTPKAFTSKLIEELANCFTYNMLAFSSLGVEHPETPIMEKFQKVNERLKAGGFDKRP